MTGDKGFCWIRPPLLRVTLIRLAEEVYQLVWSYHHLLLDGWSLAQALRELFIYYEIIRLDEVYLMPAPHPYRDYINWLQQQDEEKAAAYWQAQLADITAPTPLVMQDWRPVDKENEVVPEERQLELTAEATAVLQATAKQHQLTMSTLVQAAWSYLLSRYTGEADVIFGSVVSGRPASLANVETIVGPFINTLPVRVHIEPDEPVLAWLTALNQQMVEMREYEYSALVDIQQWSSIPRDQPLFETTFVFENYPLALSLEDERLSLKISDLQDREQTNFALGLLAVPGERLLLKIAYDSLRFQAETIARMLGHLETILMGMAADINQPLADLPLLTTTEQEQLLKLWHTVTAPYEAQPISQLFATQAARTPQVTAVTFQEQQLTYAELNRQANRLAHYLRSVGIGPETVVGVHIERSLEMIVAVLGILKAGGAYLPLDPAYPKSRLGFMLNEVQAPLVLTTQALAPSLAAFTPRLFCLDTEKLTLATFSADDPPPLTTVENLAYVIYTSGSAGQPKGTLLTHDGVANLVAFQQRLLEIGPGSQVLQFASLNFDGAVWEIFPPLCSGATIHLGPLETMMNGLALAQMMKERGITMATLPPSVLRLMPDIALPDLQALWSAGEACTADIVAQWGNGRFFYNGYGPTETTVGVTFGQIQPGQDVHIGRPFPNKEIFVLDPLLRPVPVGVPGELYAGGSGLARGYLARPALTTAQFIPHPFSDVPDARLYRTGDLVRYRPDGALEFLGRVDNQVKLRGFRIELGEIEAAMYEYEGVAETAVIVREDIPGHQQLAGYYRVTESDMVDPQDLRQHLKNSLPSYMIPAALMPLDKFPLTINGKVDREALPQPEIHRERKEIALPKNNTETSILAVWKEVLHREEISVDDNFFDLGGHSLLIMQMNSKLQKTLQRDIPIMDLFRHPTVQTLAAHLSDAPEDSLREKVSDRIQKQREALRKQREALRKQQQKNRRKR